jgi:hypothetical protein
MEVQKHCKLFLRTAHRHKLFLRTAHRRAGQTGEAGELGMKPTLCRFAVQGSETGSPAHSTSEALAAGTRAFNTRPAANKVCAHASRRPDVPTTMDAANDATDVSKPAYTASPDAASPNDAADAAGSDAIRSPGGRWHSSRWHHSGNGGP